MKYYTYVEPDENDKPRYVTLSEDEIIKDYWDYWCTQMKKVGKDINNYTHQDCIDDFCVIHWAFESNDDGSAIYE